jgi:hypothetical protein
LVLAARLLLTLARIMVGLLPLEVRLHSVVKEEHLEKERRIPLVLQADKEQTLREQEQFPPQWVKCQQEEMDYHHLVQSQVEIHISMKAQIHSLELELLAQEHG